MGKYYQGIERNFSYKFTEDVHYDIKVDGRRNIYIFQSFRGTLVKNSAFFMGKICENSLTLFGVYASIIWLTVLDGW